MKTFVIIIIMATGIESTESTVMTGQILPTTYTVKSDCIKQAEQIRTRLPSEYTSIIQCTETNKVGI